MMHAHDTPQPRPSHCQRARLLSQSRKRAELGSISQTFIKHLPRFAYGGSVVVVTLTVLHAWSAVRACKRMRTHRRIVSPGLLSDARADTHTLGWSLDGQPQSHQSVALVIGQMKRSEHRALVQHACPAASPVAPESVIRSERSKWADRRTEFVSLRTPAQRARGPALRTVRTRLCWTHPLFIWLLMTVWLLTLAWRWESLIEQKHRGNTRRERRSMPGQ